MRGRNTLIIPLRTDVHAYTPAANLDIKQIRLVIKLPQFGQTMNCEYVNGCVRVSIKYTFTPLS